MGLVICGLLPPTVYWRMINAKLETESPLSAVFCGLEFPLRNVYPATRLHMLILFLLALGVFGLVVSFLIIIRVCTPSYNVNVATVNALAVGSILLFLLTYLHNANNSIQSNGIYPPAIEITGMNKLFDVSHQSEWIFGSNIHVYSLTSRILMRRELIAEHFDFIVFMENSIYDECSDSSTLFHCNREETMTNCNLILIPSTMESELSSRYYDWMQIHTQWGFAGICLAIISLILKPFSCQE